MLLSISGLVHFPNADGLPFAGPRPEPACCVIPDIFDIFEVITVASDMTEPGQPDVPHLLFDGVDDRLETAPVDFGSSGNRAGALFSVGACGSLIATFWPARASVSAIPWPMSPAPMTAI